MCFFYALSSTSSLTRRRIRVLVLFAFFAILCLVGHGVDWVELVPSEEHAWHLSLFRALFLQSNGELCRSPSLFPRVVLVAATTSPSTESGGADETRYPYGTAEKEEKEYLSTYDAGDVDGDGDDNTAGVYGDLGDGDLADAYDEIGNDEGEEEEEGGEEGEKEATGFNALVKPHLVPWRKLRGALRGAGCFTTRALPRLTTAAVEGQEGGAPGSSDGRFTHLAAQRSGGAFPAAAATPAPTETAVRVVNRTDRTASPLSLPPLCRKPVVLISGRTRDCASCNAFAEAMAGQYAAEWAFIRAHVTLVDAGDPLTEQLVRFPFPLWYDVEGLSQLLTLTPRFARPEPCDGAARCGDSGHDDASDLQREDAEAEYHLFSAGLRQKAALMLKAPAAQAGHRWSHVVRRTFAFPSEYMLRIVFVYPHNGSVMRDVVNDGVLEGSSPDYLHFFTNAKHFFAAVKKAVRVMDWLERYGDY